MTSVLIVADDLTGAADTAAGFTGRGRSVAVSLAGALPACDVVAVDTDTRRSSAEDAASAVRQAVEQGRQRAADSGSKPQLLYNKVDSTLRGNVAAELAAFVDAAPHGLCVFAPAFPATGRTTKDGVQYVHGVPLARTEMWRLARRPAPADVDSILRETGLPMAAARLPQIRAGAAPLRHELGAAYADGARIVVCDAEDDADLAVIADAASDLDVPVHWAGSGGLAGALAALRAAAEPSEQPAAEPVAGAAGRILAVVGSASEQARAQARHLNEAGLRRIEVDALALIDDDADAQRRSTAALREALTAGDAIVTIGGGAVIGERRAARAAVTALARLVRPSLPDAGMLVVTGGETARALLRAADVEWFEVYGQVEPGVVHGTARAGDIRWSLVTKAGAFGDEYALTRAVEALRARASRPRKPPAAGHPSTGN